jgi:hypothetical protein
MEAAENEVGAARADLAVAVKPVCSVGAGRDLEAEGNAGRHVLEEAGIHACDFDVADRFRVERLQQADRRIDRGREIAIGEGHPDHHAPLTVEHVAEARTVPIRGELLVRVRLGLPLALPIQLTFWSECQYSKKIRPP